MPPPVSVPVPVPELSLAQLHAGLDSFLNTYNHMAKVISDLRTQLSSREVELALVKSQQQRQATEQEAELGKLHTTNLAQAADLEKQASELAALQTELAQLRPQASELTILKADFDSKLTTKVKITRKQMTSATVAARAQMIKDLEEAKAPLAQALVDLVGARSELVKVQKEKTKACSDLEISQIQAQLQLKTATISADAEKASAIAELNQHLEETSHKNATLILENTSRQASIKALEGELATAKNTIKLLTEKLSKGIVDKGDAEAQDSVAMQKMRNIAIEAIEAINTNCTGLLAALNFMMDLVSSKMTSAQWLKDLTTDRKNGKVKLSHEFCPSGLIQGVTKWKEDSNIENFRAVVKQIQKDVRLDIDSPIIIKNVASAKIFWCKAVLVAVEGSVMADNTRK